MTPRIFFSNNIVGIHYAVRIGIGSAILWFLTMILQTSSPLWALISLIIVTEPHMRLAWIAFRSRMLNTIVGAAVGFTVLTFGTPTAWMLIEAVTFTALLATYINRFEQGWRLAPITTALIVSSGMTQASIMGGLHIALSRTFEVFLGGAVALAVSIIMGRIWLPPRPSGEAVN